MYISNEHTPDLRLAECVSMAFSVEFWLQCYIGWVNKIIKYNKWTYLLGSHNLYKISIISVNLDVNCTTNILW